jgi:suppressor of ftsI
VLRRFAAFLIAFAWLAGCGGRASGPVNPIPPNSSLTGPQNPPTNVNELPEPPVVKSVNGVAKVDLEVTFSGATGFPQFTFKGLGGVAPTIRVNPGDRIEMTVADDLLPRKGERDNINIHFHGLGSSPRPPGDDVLGTMARPGQTLHYVVHVPKNQEPGLYWYHPHVHGQTTYQVGSGGMSGAIIINGLEHHLPGLAKMKERMIVVRATGVGENAPPVGGDADESGSSDMSDMSGMSAMASPTAKPKVVNSEPCGSDLGLTTTLNGAFQPVITIAPGEKQFFRVVNATGHKTLKLSTGGDLVVVAIDGFALDTWPGTPPTETVKSIVIPPAARAEFVVTGPKNGYGSFRTLCYDTGFSGDRDPDLLLAKMRAPKGKGNDTSFHGALTVGAPLPQNVYTTALPPPAAKRVVIFSEGPSHFFLNGKEFHMSAPPMFTVHTGTVEEWRLVNITEETHDFHLHQAHFLVKQIDGVRLVHPYWADSVVLPHRRKDGKPGTMVITADFRDPTIKGTFLFHCHILDHEDAGMMAKIQAI